MLSNIFVGRQPIFNRKGNIFAYELLYRNSHENYFPTIAPEKATIELLVNTFLNIGYDEVANRTKVFINFTEKLLYEEVFRQLDPRFVTIEVLEDVSVTEILLKQLRRLKKRGFTIALDDFVIHQDSPLYDELFKVVDIIKVDFRHTSKAERATMEVLPEKYRHLTLLAEKIETIEEYTYALQNEYGLFQGYLFAKPEIIEGKDITSSHAFFLLLFQKLNEQEPDINQITNIIKRDVSLSYKLLRYINSLSFGMPNKISSIRQAIMIMGLRKARKWLQLLLFYEIGSGDAKGRERALIEDSIIRARTCEQLAAYKGKNNSDEYFLLGMFSRLDIIMNEDWQKLLPKLSLTEEVEVTLCGEDTPMQDYLQLATTVEAFDMEKMSCFAEKLEVPMEKLSEISFTAHRWAICF